MARMDSLDDVIVKLQKLNCPYISNDVKAEGWIDDVLFVPGKPRIEFFKWLFKSLGINCRVDFNADLVTETKSLTKIAVTNCLCSSNEEDLITGLATKERQTAFISYLSSLLVFQSKDKPVEPDSTPFDVTLPLDVTARANCDQSMKVDPQLLAAWKCMTRIITEGHFMKSIDAEMTIKMPIGLHKELERTKSDCKIDVTKVMELRNKVQKLRTTLNGLPNIAIITEDQNLRLNGRMMNLEAASSRFVKLYDDEMKFWCRDNTPSLSSLGTLCDKIEVNLSTLVQVTDDIDRLRQFHLEETPKFKAQVLDIEEKLDSVTSRGLDKDNLRSDVIFILDSFASIMEKWNAIQEAGNSDADASGMFPS